MDRAIQSVDGGKSLHDKGQLNVPFLMNDEDINKYVTCYKREQQLLSLQESISITGPYREQPEDPPLLRDTPESSDLIIDYCNYNIYKYIKISIKHACE